MSTTGPAIPQPHELGEQEKEDAMGAYLMMFASLGLGFPLPLLSMIASIVYFAMHRRKSRFVAFHALQALLSQIPVTLVNVGLVAWLVKNLATDLYFSPAFWVYLVFVVLLNVLDIIVSLVVMARARKGRFSYLPVFGRLCFGVYYGPGAAEMEEPVEPNRPPAGF